MLRVCICAFLFIWLFVSILVKSRSVRAQTASAIQETVTAGQMVRIVDLDGLTRL